MLRGLLYLRSVFLRCNYGNVDVVATPSIDCKDQQFMMQRWAGVMCLATPSSFIFETFAITNTDFAVASPQRR